MTQKILAGRADDPNLKGEFVRVKVDQVVLARDPDRVLSEPILASGKKCAVEVGIAYDTRCVTSLSDTGPGIGARGVRDALNLGMLVARPGIGFPAAVHLERFGSPARLALTDEPRLASVGGAGMLTLVVPPSQLAEALVTGSVSVRPLRSVQVLLSGRVRPFVCVRDVGLELMRRGLGEAVRRVDAEQRAPVVIEFAGPSARLLSVTERAVLAALAPQLGAAGAVFVSDEKTEVYLRDQRRSKAHRGLLPDAGAPCDDVMSVDLSAVDPLVLDEDGVVRPVRELAGKPVSQVILGGDSGTSLRDLLAAGALLKSKRVPSKLDLLLAPPSRQVLQVLAESGALVDFIATGARLLESDPRLITGELYPPPAAGASLRTFDPEPSFPLASQRFVVASAETLAFAVATGVIGDPRSFKRPVRVTVPRTLPTDDVLIARKAKSKSKEAETKQASADAPRAHGFDRAQTLPVVATRGKPSQPSALVLETLDDVRWFARRAPELSDTVRAIVAPHIPSGTVPLLAGLGILALMADDETIKKLRASPSLALPSAAEADGKPTITVSAGSGPVDLVWLAVGIEREWTSLGTARDATVKR
ncbi:MAG TPA: aconitase family protein [Polyangiaceae bacterium]|jgi:aconitate hydratase